jgi:hypothetical protein
VEMKGWESKRLMEAKEMMTNRFYALKAAKLLKNDVSFNLMILTYKISTDHGYMKIVCICGCPHIV